MATPDPTLMEEVLEALSQPHHEAIEDIPVVNLFVFSFGWARPENSKHWHFFINNKSICDGSNHVGKKRHGNNDSPQNCRACQDRLGVVDAHRLKSDIYFHPASHIHFHSAG